MQKKILVIIGIIFPILITFILYPKFKPSPSSPETPIYKDLIITLERTSCYGTCPIYKLTITGDGKVTYEGKKFVKVVGIQTSQISQEKIKELVSEFYKINYFSLEDKYSAPVSDMPTRITSISLNGQNKRVENYAGAPPELGQLETKIDEITNSMVWIGEE